MNERHPHKPSSRDEDEKGRLPPHDLDAEAAVLSACLLTGTCEAVAPILRAGDFFSHANQTIFTALLSLETEGRRIDVLTLKSRLSDDDRLQNVGGAPYLAKLLDETPAVANVAEHAEIVAVKSRLRRLLYTAQKIAVETYVVNGEAAEFIARAVADIEWAANDSAPSKSLFTWEGATDIMGKLPPIRWVCRELCIGPGRPTLVQGYGFSGKTMALQAFALAVAAGKPAFGYFRVVQGRVLHIDYEQGKHATKRRYQRMMLAMGLSLDDIGERLQLTCFPSAYLTDTGIEKRLAKECAGVAVCIIDSFRAAIPGQDENESTVRQFLDMLTRISETSGCSFVVVHHSGKGGKEKDSREKSRGSSAIFDACGTVIDLFAAKPFEPIKVAIVKASASNEGRSPEPFYLCLQDIASEDGADTKAGLLVEHMTSEQVEQPEAPSDSWRRDLDEVLTCLRANSGNSQNTIAGLCGKRKDRVRDCLKELERVGYARHEKAAGRDGGGGHMWFSIAKNRTEDGDD